MHPMRSDMSDNHILTTQTFAKFPGLQSTIPFPIINKYPYALIEPEPNLTLI